MVYWMVYVSLGGDFFTATSTCLDKIPRKEKAATDEGRPASYHIVFCHLIISHLAGENANKFTYHDGLLGGGEAASTQW